MKEHSKSGVSTVIVVLFVIIAILVVGIGFLFLKYEQLEEKYEDMYENDNRLENNNMQDDNFNNIDGSGNQNNNNSNTYISNDSALQAVLDDMKVSQNDLYDLDIELKNKKRYTNTVYEISFNYNGYEYEYYIDTITGSILDSFKERD